VIDGTGKVQVQRILKAGDALNFSSPPPYSVVLGRADAVQVQVRGRPFDVTPFARNSVARFEVK
jgi:cytoskeleton protein RodZ